MAHSSLLPQAAQIPLSSLLRSQLPFLVPVWAPLQSTRHDDTVIFSLTFPNTVIPLLQVTLWLAIMELAQGYSSEVRELA